MPDPTSIQYQNHPMFAYHQPSHDPHGYNQMSFPQSFAAQANFYGNENFQDFS